MAVLIIVPISIIFSQRDSARLPTQTATEEKQRTIRSISNVQVLSFTVVFRLNEHKGRSPGISEKSSFRPVFPSRSSFPSYHPRNNSNGIYYQGCERSSQQNIIILRKKDDEHQRGREKAENPPPFKGKNWQAKGRGKGKKAACFSVNPLISFCMCWH